MPINISVSDEIYRKLESLAVGFDTPERVIERLIEQCGAAAPTREEKPKLSFVPNEAAFKSGLLTHKRAQIVLKSAGGGRDVIHWNAARFQPSSNLRANLWSGCLRGWKEKNILSAELSLLPRGTAEPGDDTELMIAIAEQLHWTIEEVESHFVDIDLQASDDGCPYFYLATFSDDTPEILKKIAGFDGSNQYGFDLGIIPQEGDFPGDDREE